MAVTLTDVETAISAIQSGGQSFTLDGIAYTAANLAALVALRDRLKRESGISSGTRPTFRGCNIGLMGYS